MKNIKKKVYTAFSADTLHNGHNLEFTNESFRQDREIVLAAIRDDAYALQYADENNC